MSKILDELKRIDSEDKVAIKNNKVVQESTLLLEAPKEDTSLLEEFGIDHQIRRVKVITDLSNRQKAIGELFESETYTGEQIRQLCCKHYLKMLPISFFRGNIPPELSKELKAFADKNNIILTGNRYNFFVLADFNQFTQDRHEDTESIDKAVKINFTPIIFYREGNREEIAKVDQVFTKVYSWGESNINWTRGLKFLFSGADANDAIPPIVRTIFAAFLLLLAMIFGAVGIIYVPVILIGLASIVIYSNLRFKITTDLLWNKAHAAHK